MQIVYIELGMHPSVLSQATIVLFSVYSLLPLLDSFGRSEPPILKLFNISFFCLAPVS